MKKPKASGWRRERFLFGSATKTKNLPTANTSTHTDGKPHSDHGVPKIQGIFPAGEPMKKLPTPHKPTPSDQVKVYPVASSGFDLNIPYRPPQRRKQASK